MAPRLRLKLAAGLMAALQALTLAFPAVADDANVISKGSDNIAILGYDTVAYFTENRAVRGKAEFGHDWNDARWLFANSENRDLFSSNPEAYAPRFGGFCTGGMSLNYIQEANPENWVIVDGKLYLTHSKAGLDRLRADPEVVIGAAENNWVVLSQHYDPADTRSCTTCAPN